ncbi:MAG: hypothetical protein WC641_08425 [Patescibacteria group bacterium]
MNLTSLTNQELTLKADAIQMAQTLLYGEMSDGEILETEALLADQIDEIECELAFRKFRAMLQGRSLGELEQLYEFMQFASLADSERRIKAVEIEIAWTLHEQGLDLMAA